MRLSTQEVVGRRIFFADDNPEPVAEFEYDTNTLMTADGTIKLRISPTCMTMPKVVDQMLRISKKLSPVLNHGDK